MYGWIGDNVFLVSTCLCKIAVLLLYRRMVAGTCSKKMLWASWIGIAFTAIYGIVFIALLCATCKPLDAYWKSYDLTYKGPYQCSRPGVGMPLSGSLSVASDFYAVVLPYFLVRNLQISKRQKFGLYVVFGFGLLVVGCGIARTVYLDRIARSSYDLTWVGFDVFAASLLESQLSIIGACLPSLRKMFGTYFGDSLSKAYSNIRYGTPRGLASSKGSKASEGRRAIANREKRILSTNDDIELTAGSVTMDTGSIAKGNSEDTIDHDYFEKAYVKRFANATFTEDDLPTRESRNGPRLKNVTPTMVLSFILIQNRQGKTRLAKWYAPFSDEEKVKLKGEVHRLIAPRDQKHQSNFVEFRGREKIVYRRYAGLFFCACVDANDNELAYLEAIHFFVEVLDAFFGNVCELDLVFNFYKVYAILDEVFLAGEIEETSKQVVLTRLEHLDKLE
ncbi:MAG: hypothetical protein Q9165_002782 [Trypethelium subeluteriae]